MAERNNIIPRRCMKCGQLLIGKASVLRKHGRLDRAKAQNEAIVKKIADDLAAKQRQPNLRP